PTPPTTPPPPPAPAPAAATVPPPLPQPERVPADPYADVAVVAIGEIEIPRIGLDTPLYEGVWQTVIDVGPGHWPGTAEPGGWGNSVIAGHRSSYTEPFRHLDQLVPGDEIVVRTPAGAFTYAVTGSEIVDDSALHIVDQAPGRTITVFTCHPVGSAVQRYVVRGTLAG
ncbi:MAG TPA: class D sortase, partial [Acidimicrobiia bacterium]